MAKRYITYYDYKLYDELQDDKGVVRLTNEAIGGQSEKMFVRFNSELLTDFFADISKGNTSYVTYLDDIAPEYAKTGKAPLKAVSLLMKMYSSDCKYGSMEDMGSRVGNLLGIPVVYNKLQKCGSVNFLLSIDYMKFAPNIKYGTIEGDYYTAPHEGHNHYTYSNWLDFFDRSVLKNRYTGKLLNDNQILQILRGFTPSYFFRKYILEDTDFDLYNMGIIYDEATGKYSFGPNYDMERAMVKKNRINQDFEINLPNDIQEAFEMFPNEMKAFMDRLKFVQQNNLINHELLKNISSKFSRRKIIKRLNNNIDSVCLAYDMYRAKVKDNEGM